MIDDIIYISLLFFCIGFGYFFRTIKNDDQKKYIGTAVGFLIVLIVSYLHIFHTIICIFIGGFIILVIDIRRCHLVCFAYMFSYLLFFRSTKSFGLPTPPGHTNLIQMILTLKLVGLAFERNNAYMKKRLIDEAGDYLKKTELTPLTPVEQELLNLKFVDIVHYCFCYIGVLTGPYYSYKTFRDFWNLPFKNYANCDKETINKLKWVPLYVGLFLFVGYIWPLEYAIDAEFYETRSVLYRLWYVWPLFFIFRMRIYAGLTLSECVCTMAGFGAYPNISVPRSGAGPTKDYLQYLNSPESVEYNFETIRNIAPYSTETCWTFREAMKHWNMCVQYWMASTIYKRFPYKNVRTIATLLVSSYWHGVHSGYYLCMMCAPFYLPIEDLHNKLFRNDATGILRTIIDVLFWISKFFAYSYMGVAFYLMTLEKSWFYYKSVYHFGYILWLVLYLIGFFFMKQKKLNLKRIKAKDGDKEITDSSIAVGNKNE